MGGALAAIERRLRGAPLFARRPLRRLTNVRITGSTASVRRFRPGLDYTVAHGGSLTSEARLDLTLCVVKNGDSGAGGAAAAKPDEAAASASAADDAEAWQSGEVGGFEAYIAAEDDENPEVRKE